MASPAEDIGFKPRLAPLRFSKVVYEIKLEIYYKVWCHGKYLCVGSGLYSKITNEITFKTRDGLEIQDRNVVSQTIPRTFFLYG